MRIRPQLPRSYRYAPLRIGTSFDTSFHMDDTSPQQADQWTVLRLLNWTKDFFERSGVDSPWLAAEVLLAHCIGSQRIELYARFDYQPDPAQLKAYRQWVKRAGAREPVAYLVGHKEFYSLKFTVTPDVLIPRPETEMLVSEAISHLKQLGAASEVWDVCTGSGCVGIAIASQVKNASVLATDISGEAIAVAKQNAEAHSLAERVHCCVADLLTLPADAPMSGPFDVITANPPYVAEDDEVAPEVKHEPQLALIAAEGGLACIRKIVAAAASFIKPGGLLAMEFGCGQASDVRDLIVATGEFEEPRILRDHQEIERAAIAVRK